ncbi:MAG: 50S ribosomal protein L32 [Chloroflexi bacterium]|nr:50S ribosomal protein L32 [Chloroflexota bacterium]MCI0849899.1 50S ribosomal protein L32 [Chloroflexota bacterium]
MHRSHHHTKAVALTECSHCHNARQPHMVCPNCGYYHGREAVVVSVPELPE